MSAAPQTTPQRQLAKVLRIGLVQEGRIVQERLIKIGESVFIGTGPRNTFEVSGDKIPPRMEVFSAKGNSYSLVIPDWAEGMLSSKEGVRDLDDIRKLPETGKKGEFFVIPINEDTRGKVVLSGISILFQFVPAPPEPAKTITPADFKPKFFDDEDPLFMGLLAVFSFFAGIFLVWVHFTPVSEEDDLSDIDAAVDLIIDRLPPPPPIDNTPVTDEGTKPEAEKPKENKAESDPKPNNTAPSDAKAAVQQKSLLIQAIGQNGTGVGVAEDLLGDDAATQASLDAALKGASGVEMANAGNINTYKGGTGGPTDSKVEVGSVGTGEGARTGAGTVALKPKVQTGGQDMSIDEGDSATVGGVIKRYAGKIEACTSTAIKTNPGTKGRVSVTWQIVGGQVKGATLVSNQTGDAALGECIVRAVRSFRFDASVTGTVDQYTWIVSAQ